MIQNHNSWHPFLPIFRNMNDFEMNFKALMYSQGAYQFFGPNDL